MIHRIRPILVMAPLLAGIFLAGCASESKYDSLQAENQALRQQSDEQAAQIAADMEQIGRLQGAIKYTVNSDLLFASGGWEMSPQGKQIITNMATKLAPTQRNKILVSGYTDNTAIGPALQQQGVTSNQLLSQKRADTVMQFLISQGLNPSLVSAKGFGEADPIASNDTAQGRAQNRRVELSLANAVS
ncbi:MAG TPA: OmpA family protein [Acetobacteraceae bacterium]|jgi:chemotaxis protein MotB